MHQFTLCFLMVPEPLTFVLLGSALAVLGAAGRRRRRKE